MTEKVSAFAKKEAHHENVLFAHTMAFAIDIK